MAATHGNVRHILPPDAEIIACLNQGMTAPKIADHFGVGYDAMVRRIRNHGLRLLMDSAQPVPAPVQREGIVIDRRVSYVFGRNEFREIEISLPAVSILRDCARYGRTSL